MQQLENIANFSWYTGNLKWLKENTIFLTRSGSHAYGTNIEGSDEDFCGVAIAPINYYLGNLNKFEVMEHKGNPDIKIFDIKKFFELAGQCNPNIIELLFTDESAWVIANPFWHGIYKHRQHFLSKEARDRFTGYAISQLNRIKTHRSYLLNPIEKQPQRKDFGLPQDRKVLDKEQFNVIEARIRKLEDKLGGEGWTKDKVEIADESVVQEALKGVDINPNLIPIIIAERKYNSAMREYNKYQTWKAERNPKRAELESKFGFDTKHGMHLVRLMTSCKQLLETGTFTTRRPDAEFLLSIRNGAWTYDELMLWARKMEREMDEAYAKSTLPNRVDKAKLDNLLVRLIENFHD